MSSTRDRFFQAMLARIPQVIIGPDGQAASLAALRTRDLDDPTIALMYAWASAADVLSFYNAQVADEAYLSSARERLSLTYLAADVGYQPEQFIGASTRLAVLVNPRLATPLTIPARARFNSNPLPGGAPLVFETRAPVVVNAARNQLQAVFQITQTLTEATCCVVLNATQLGLSPGDAILLATAPFLANPSPASEAWQVVTLTAVQEQAAQGVTEISWGQSLGQLWQASGPGDAPWPLAGGAPIQIVTFASHVGLFGKTAPAWATASAADRLAVTPFGLHPDDFTDWPNLPIDWGTLELESIVGQVVAGGLVLGLAPGDQHLGVITSVTTATTQDWPPPRQVTKLVTAARHERQLDRLLSPARRDHSATRLSNGQVLMAGGRGADGKALASAFIWDPTTQLVQAVASMTEARAGHSAHLLADGVTVLVFGGIDASGKVLGSAETLNGSNPGAAWESVAIKGAIARAYHAATPLPSPDTLLGGGLAADGSLAADAQRLHLDPTAWSAALPMALTGPRIRHAQTPWTLAGRTTIALAGGYDGHQARADLEIYDLEEDQMSRLVGALQAPRAGFGAGSSSDSATSWLALTGGRSGPGVETGADAGSDLPDAPTITGEALQPGMTDLVGLPLPSELVRHAVVSTDDGHVMVYGGQSLGSPPTPQAWRIDPFRGEAQVMADLPCALVDHTATVAIGTPFAVVAGGLCVDGSSSDQVFARYLGTPWSYADALAIDTAGCSITPLDGGGVLIAGTGSREGLALVVDAAGLVVKSIALSAPRASQAAVLLDDGRVLLAGGDNQGDVVPAVEIVDVAAGVSVLEAFTLSQGRSDPAALRLTTGAVLVAGGAPGSWADLVTETGVSPFPLICVTQHMALAPLPGGLILACGSDGAVIILNEAGEVIGVPSLTGAQGRPAAVALPDGTCLIAQGASLIVVSQVEGIWTMAQVATTAVPLNSPSAVLTPSGAVLISDRGGPDVVRYDPNSRTTSLETIGLPLVGSQLARVREAGALAVGGVGPDLRMMRAAEPGASPATAAAAQAWGQGPSFTTALDDNVLIAEFQAGQAPWPDGSVEAVIVLQFETDTGPGWIKAHVSQCATIAGVSVLTTVENLVNLIAADYPGDFPPPPWSGWVMTAVPLAGQTGLAWSDLNLNARQTLAPFGWAATDLTDWPAIDPGGRLFTPSGGEPPAGLLLVCTDLGAANQVDWLGVYGGVMTPNIAGLPVSAVTGVVFIRQPPAVTPGIVETSATLPSGRSGHAAASLTDGRVLIAGGRSSGGLLAETWLFNAVTGSLVAGPPLPAPTADATLTLRSDGALVFAGGVTPQDVSAEVYLLAPSEGPPSNWAFQSMGPMSAARAGHAAAAVGDGGLVVLAGGTGGDGAWLASFDVAGAQGLMQNGMMSRAYSMPVAAVVEGGVMVLMDASLSEESTGMETLALSSGPAGLVVAAPAAVRLPLARAGARIAACQVPTLVFVGGGVAGQAPATIYEISRWSTLDPRLARADHLSWMEGRGAIGVAGGEMTQAVPLAAAAWYVDDPDSAVAPRSAPRVEVSQAASAPLVASTPGAMPILINGGLDAKGVPTGTVQAYDPSIETFVPAGRLVSAPLINLLRMTLMADGGVFLSFADQTRLWRNDGRDIAVGPSLTISLQGHAAALLADGRIILAGSNDITPTSYIYTPATKALTPGPPMVSPRWQHLAVSLGPGHGVIFIGGADDNYETPASASEILDSGGVGFTAVPGGPPPDVTGHAALMMADGSVTSCGGFCSATAALGDLWTYDPGQGWRDQPSAMLYARAWHTATTLLDGRVLIIGGLDAEQNLVATAEIYDPTTRTSQPTGALQQSRYYHVAALMPDGRVVVTGGAQVGGYDNPVGLRTAEIYDPATGLFTLSDVSLAGHAGCGGVWSPGQGLLIAAGAGEDGQLNDQVELFRVPPRSIDGARRTTQILLRNTPQTPALIPDPSPIAPGDSEIPLQGAVPIATGDSLMMCGAPPYAQVMADIHGLDAYGGPVTAPAETFVIVYELATMPGADLANPAGPELQQVRLGLHGGGLLAGSCLRSALEFLADPDPSAAGETHVCQPAAQADPALLQYLPRPIQAEMVAVESVIAKLGQTQVTLGAFTGLYARAGLSFYGNVVEVFEGRSILNEVLGGGDTAGPSASYLLRLSPVVSVLTDDTASLEVEVWISDILWTRQDRLDLAGPRDQVYRLDADSLGRVRVTFGDGVEGAMPTPGTDNITATYRVGGGEAGNLPPLRFTLAPDSVPAIDKVYQPLAAQGGVGRPTGALRRRISDSTVALDRVVALEDLTSFARNWPGVSAALALPATGAALLLDALTSAQSALIALLPVLPDAQTALAAPIAAAADQLVAAMEALEQADPSIPQGVAAFEAAAAPVAPLLALSPTPLALEAPLAQLAEAAAFVARLNTPDAAAYTVTVAGREGQVLDAATLSGLQSAYQRFDPASGALVVPRNYAPVYFDLAMTVATDPRLAASSVLDAVTSALNQRWGYDFDRLGEPLYASQALATVLAVPGVRAANVTDLYLYGRTPALENLLPADISPAGVAELLILRELSLSAMSVG